MRECNSFHRYNDARLNFYLGKSVYIFEVANSKPYQKKLMIDASFFIIHFTHILSSLTDTETFLDGLI